MEYLSSDWNELNSLILANLTKSGPSLFFVLGSEAGKKTSGLAIWEKIARDPPAWRGTRNSQAVFKAEPEFCRRDEKWVMYSHLQDSWWMLNNACLLQSSKLDCELSKRVSSVGYDYDGIFNQH